MLASMSFRPHREPSTTPEAGAGSRWIERRKLLNAFIGCVQSTRRARAKCCFLKSFQKTLELK